MESNLQGQNYEPNLNTRNPMVPADFEQSQIVLSAPEGQEGWCEPLNVAPVRVGDDVGILSCWKVTKEELEEIQRTGRVWLIVYGSGMPPVSLNGISPFKETDDRLDEAK